MPLMCENDPICCIYFFNFSVFFVFSEAMVKAMMAMVNFCDDALRKKEDSKFLFRLKKIVTNTKTIKRRKRFLTGITGMRNSSLKINLLLLFSQRTELADLVHCFCLY